MATINLTNKQIRLIQDALELYSRVGTLHLDVILDNPTVHDNIMKKFTSKKELEVGDNTMRGEIVEITKKHIKTKGHWGNREEIKTWTDIKNIKLSPNWSEVHKTRDEIGYYLNKIKNLTSGTELGNGGNLGIHNKNVDESCREAFDMIQVIRHEFWKENPNRSNITVDSNVSLISTKELISVKLDSLRKEKLKKLNNI